LVPMPMESPMNRAILIRRSLDFIGNRFEDRNKIRKITLQVNSDISPMPFRPEDFNDSDYFVKEILETVIRII